MSRSPAQLLQDLLLDAARVAVASPQFAGQHIDPRAFASVNRAGMLDLIAGVPAFRAELRDRYAAELGDTHPLLLALVGTDPAASAAAAVRLRDPAALRVRKTRGKAGKDGTGPDRAVPASGDLRAVMLVKDRLEQRLAEARKARDQARAQRDYAREEAAHLRRELAEAEEERDESLAVVEAVRAELAAARTHAAAAAGDLMAAATLLRDATQPGPAVADVAAVDVDPRQREELLADAAGRNPEPGHAAAVAAGQGELAALADAIDEVFAAGAPDERVAAALDRSGLHSGQLLSFLSALLAPPAPPAPVWVGEPREIAMTPLGGGTEIGGSCMLVTAGDIRIVVDAGTRPKRRIDQAGPEHIDVALAGRIDAIVLTHAHTDHAGFVPAITAQQPNVPVICTPETAALLPTMWYDSVRVFSRTRGEFLEDGEPLAEPPYGDVQVSAALRRVRETDCGRVVEVGGGVSVELFPAGHILGAAGVVITAGPDRVTITGDVSDLAQATVPGLVVPESARGSDLLVIESTYCAQQNSNREAEVERFIRMVRETVGDSSSGGGRVLVPAFALGRAQEVALTLSKRLPDVPVLIDGMARDITRVYEEQTEDWPQPLEIYGEQVTAVRRGEGPHLRRTFRRGVIVTTSGMLTSGPAVSWARTILPDPESALLIAGYQDADSPGAELLDLADGKGPATFVLEREEVDVRARVAKFGLSAHADRRGLSSIITEVGAGEVMLVHGVASRQRDFADNLTRRGFTIAPTRHWHLPG